MQTVQRPEVGSGAVLNPDTITWLKKPWTIYLAARYSRRLELCEYRKQLREIGHLVEARWLDGAHQISDSGAPLGNDGEKLVEGDDGSASPRAAELRAQFADDDWTDVLQADLAISFTEPPRSEASRGGRHVEFGMALAHGHRVIVVGYRENLFHWIPWVEFYPKWEEVLERLSRREELFRPWAPADPAAHP